MVFADFDESQKFFLLIDRCHAIDIIMEAKSRKFSQHFYRSYQTTKPFSCLTFVFYGNYKTLPKIYFM